MKRLTTIISTLFLTMLATTTLASGSAVEKKELVFLNWSEYMDPDLIKKFEDQHNAVVKDIYFESDDSRDNYMLETQGKGVDIICINTVQARLYRKQKWIAPLTEKEVPNLKHIDKTWIAKFDSAEGYVLPYFWGTTGIAYRTDLYKGKITSWSDLFRPDESLRGKIAMIGANRDLIGHALKSLGYSINSSNKRELQEAKELLLQQKPYVHSYKYLNLDETSALHSGEIIFSMTYNGDALVLMDQNENIGYAVPEEGTAIWLDSLVVSNASKNKQLAYQFMDFISQPENAAQLAEYVYYATPNSAAEKLLTDEFLSDETIYPSEEILKKSEVYTRIPPRATRIKNEIFSLITR